MARILAFANQKGGVGKTTSAVNVAASLGAMGRRVLFVDLDPQGNGTSGVGINKNKAQPSVYEVLMDGIPVMDAIQQTAFAGLWCLPANVNLAGAEILLASSQAREGTLKGALAYIEDTFDYIIIDCPPSLGLLTLNALTAAQEVIVPMQCEYFALEGLSQLLYTVDLVRQRYNRHLKLGGVILTMYDGRLNLSLAVSAEIRRYFPDKIFRTTVPRNVRLSEAPSHGKPVLYYDPHSKGAKAYQEIAGELDEKK